MPLPRVLTFNFHEPYLCLMAKTGLAFDVGIYREGPLARVWQEQYRPIPGNLFFVDEPDWRERIKTDYYDVIIAHNEMNAIDLVKSPAPKLLVFHNRRQYMETTAKCYDGDPVEAYHKLLELILQVFTPVYISRTKQESYGVPGHVLPPGIDAGEFQGYRGDIPRVLRVGNTMRDRALMFDVDLQEAACAGLESLVLGANANMAGAREAANFGEYRRELRANRCLLHVTREAYEDGYNLSMLEAMATGMPPVALANATSPVVDGVNGFIGHDAEALRARLHELLADHGLARKLGAAARETVLDQFPMQRFAEAWRQIIFEAAAARPVRQAAPPDPALNIGQVLLHYISSPTTTGRYVDEALRQEAPVITAGFRVPEDVLAMWGFGDNPPEYPAHQIDLPHRAPYADMLEGLRGATPEWYLYIDSGAEQIEPDIGLLPMRKIAWLIDTHVSPELRLEMARHFDCVFLAQKAQVAEFRAAGLPHVYWLPLGCSPQLHAVPAPGRELDIAYVGSFNPEEGGRRASLLNRVRDHFPNSFIGRAWPEEMADVYARAKIVVNACYNNDVNMRVFEAMASGALLITDEAEGLEDLFEDGVHLVVYRSDGELPGLIQQYLDDEEARERIAAAGQREVLSRHSYTHRVREMFEKAMQARDTGEVAETPEQAKPELAHEVKHNTYYEHVRRELFPFVPMKTRRLLDIGCGAGAVASTLKRERGLEFAAGVEIVEEAWRRARKVLDAAYNVNIEEAPLPFEPGSFDCILCADVLEHLVEPEAALRKLAPLLTEEGVVVISLPNARYHDVLTVLSHGLWTYVPEGIMDSTHLRWFTRRNIPAFLEAAGLELLHYQPLSQFGSDGITLGEGRTLQLGKLRLDGVSDDDYQEFLTYQHLVVAGRPGVDRLAKARYAMESGEFKTAYALAQDAIGASRRERVLIMGKALARMGNLADAAALYQDNLDLEQDMEAAAEYGILLLAMNDSTRAGQHLRKALAALPEHHRARGALGLVELHQGNHAQAVQLLREAAESSYAHEALIAPLVAAAGSAGQLDAIVPLVQGYCDFYPGNPALGCALATALIALDRNDEARDRLETILLFHPEHDEARMLLQGLEQQGPEEA